MLSSFSSSSSPSSSSSARRSVGCRRSRTESGGRWRMRSCDCSSSRSDAHAAEDVSFHSRSRSRNTGVRCLDPSRKPLADPFWLVSAQIASKSNLANPRRLRFCQFFFFLSFFCYVSFYSPLSQGQRQVFLLLESDFMSVFMLVLLYCFPVIPTLALPLPTSLCCTARGHIPWIVGKIAQLVCFPACKYARVLSCKAVCGHQTHCTGTFSLCVLVAHLLLKGYIGNVSVFSFPQ